MSTANITTPRESRAGLLVFYKLSDFDAKAIVKQRLSAGRGTFSGNDPREGDEYPALIIRDWAQHSLRADHEAGKYNRVDGSIITWDDYLDQATCNLQVFLDGNDSYWATSRSRFSPGKHGNWEPLPEGQEPQTIADEQGVWIPDAKGHWFEL